jgi:hypothetical protein
MALPSLPILTPLLIPTLLCSISIRITIIIGVLLDHVILLPWKRLFPVVSNLASVVLIHPMCCIYDSGHSVSRCWHLLGLPSDCQTCLKAFKQLKDAGDVPFKAKVAATDAEYAVLEALDNNVPSEPFDADVAKIESDRRTLEAQFRPGYDFPAHNLAIDYLDSLSLGPTSAAHVSAIDFQFDLDPPPSDLPDLWTPGPKSDAPSTMSLPDMLPCTIHNDSSDADSSHGGYR